MEEKYIEKLIETESRSKSNTKRIDNLEKRVEDIHSLTLSVKEMTTEVKIMRQDINKMDNRVMTLEEKPSKKLDQIWGYIVAAIIGGAISYIFLKLGLK